MKNKRRTMESAGRHKRIGRSGFTLIEVTISMAVVTTIVLASLGVRYLTIQQAKRGDAYSSAGKLALTLLEGWRGCADLMQYDPESRFSGQLTISPSATGPVVPTGFTNLNNESYRVVLDNMNYYATLAYKTTTGLPVTIYVCVGWKSHYEAGTLSSSDNYVHLTTYD